MATELEIRFLDIDIANFTKKLELLGATKVGEWLQERFVFQLPDKKEGEHKWIRLRTNGETATVAYKHVHANTIDGTEEVEFRINDKDFELAALFLEKCGFAKEGPQQNKRVRYILDSAEIDIDTWPGCPPWVEVEGKTQDEIKVLCHKLGLDFTKGTTKSVLDILIDEYGMDPKQTVCKF